LKEKNCSLKSVVADLVDLMARSDMEEFGEDCQPVTNGEWFPAIERAKAAIA
jgi:hypothetical protein